MFKDDWINYSISTGFKLKFKSNLNTELDHLTAVLDTAKQIKEKSSAPLELFFSGGINSQIILNAYKQLGIPIKIYIIRYTENLNVKDVSEAERICNNLNLSYKIIDFSLENFFNNDAEKIFNQWNGIDIKKLPLLKFPELSDGNSILGLDEPYIYRKEIYYTEPSQWILKFTEENFRTIEYISKSKLCAVSNWFLYDPKFLYSLIENPVVSLLTDDCFFGKISLLSTRGKIYKKYWPWFDDCKKRTGFENTKNYLLPEYMIEFHNHFIKNKIASNLQPICFEINSFKDNFYE